MSVLHDRSLEYRIYMDRAGDGSVGDLSVCYIEELKEEIKRCSGVSVRRCILINSQNLQDML